MTDRYSPEFLLCLHSTMFKKVVLLASLALSGSSVVALNTATCGAHGMSLKAENGQGPCEIAALMVGKGSKLILPVWLNSKS